MTTIHTLHTTIQFPTPSADDLLPSLHSFSFLCPDLTPHYVTWTSIDDRDPLLHSLIDYATGTLDEESTFRGHYLRACAFHRRKQHVLAARRMNLTIEGVIATVQRWIDVAGMLMMVERDAPQLATVVEPLLEQVGRQQQRLFTLLAILQGVSFTSCQIHHLLPLLHSSLDEDEEDENEEVQL